MGSLTMSSSVLSPSEMPAEADSVPARSRGIFSMIRVAARRAVDSKGLALWQVVRYSIAALYFWIGGGYFFGGEHSVNSQTLHLVENIEPGGLRTHGLILVLLAFGIASRTAFQHQTSGALVLSLFYSLLTAALIIGGWTVHKPDWSAPAWYVFVAVLSFALVVLAPPKAKRLEPQDGGASA